MIKSISGKSASSYWSIQCKICEHVSLINGRNLRKNNTFIKCENCSNTTRPHPHNLIDLTNKIICDEKFKVVSYNSTINSMTFWNVQCITCGSIQMASRKRIKNPKNTITCEKCNKVKEEDKNIKTKQHPQTDNESKTSIVYINNDSIYLFALKEGENIKFMFLEFKGDKK